MTGVIIIFLVTVAVGLVLYVYDLKWRRRHPEGLPPSGTDLANGDDAPVAEEHNGGICCGRHLICEKSLSPLPGEKPIYYDDEELDRFSGRDPDSYTPEETDEIREVMLTLLPQDLPGWVRSMQLRDIAVPTPLRDELILLLEDAE